MMKMVRKNC